MAIYDIFSTKEEDPSFQEMQMQLNFEDEQKLPSEPIEEKWSLSRLFSATAVRTFFFLLLLADLLWGVYVVVVLLLCNLGVIFTGGSINKLKEWRNHHWISLKRFLVCGMSLIVALFAPAFGILIACTYFLMYDKAGIDEVVPASLKDQIKDFYPRSES